MPLTRGSLLGAFAGITGVALVLSGVLALLASNPSVGLPAPGVEHDLKLSLSELQFTYQGQKCSASIVGSAETEVKAESTGNSDDNIVPVEQDDLQMVGTSASCETAVRRSGQNLGPIRIKQKDPEFGHNSLLEMTQQFPPKYKQTVFIDFTLTLEKPPQGMTDSFSQQREARQSPLVLSAKTPTKIVALINNFPPKGELYQLQNPIELVLPTNPDETIATIDKFPIKVDWN